MNNDKNTGCTLADCLQKLCSLYGRNVSMANILAGLPLVDGLLTPEIFYRAAAKAGFYARLSDIPGKKLVELQDPIILFLDEGIPILLLRVDVASGNAQVWDGCDQTVQPLQNILDRYTGYGITVSLLDESTLKEGHKTQSSQKASRYPWFFNVVKTHWKTYRDVLLASFLINTFALVSPLFVMNVYDRVVPNNATETLWMLAAGVVLAFLFDFALKVQRSWFIDYAGKMIDLDVSARLFEKTLGLRMASRPASTGSYINSLNDFDSIRSFITSVCITTLVDFPFIVLFLALIVWIGGALALVPVVSIVLCFLLAWGVNRPLQRRIESQQQASSSRLALVAEVLQGVEGIKTSRAESAMQLRWERLVKFLADNGLHIRRLQSFVTHGAMFVLQLNTALLVVGGVYLIGSGDLSMGGLIAVIMIAGRCAAPVTQLISLLKQYEHARQALEQGEQIMSLPQERDEGRHYLHIKKLQGAWAIQDVGFSYPEQPALLSGLNMKIKSGEKVAIVGRMGSGKTSLIKLMMGLYQPTSGNLSLDGIDLRQLDPVSLREYVGYVPQHVCMMNGSIRDNIALGECNPNDENILRAARLSGLGELISNSGHGLDFQVGEGGRNLSGGQVQAVGLARALVNDPPVLIMDEPTGAMDNHTAARVCDTLRQVCKNKTLIIVTHHLPMLALVERIIVLEKGRVIADGPAEKLAASFGGLSKKRQPEEKTL